MPCSRHDNHELEGDCDDDGYNDEDHDHDGFYDDDRDQDGRHDDDEQEGEDNDDDRSCTGGASPRPRSRQWEG